MNKKMGWNKDAIPETEFDDEYVRNAHIVLKGIDFIKRNMSQLKSLKRTYRETGDKNVEKQTLNLINKAKDDISKKIVTCNAILTKSKKSIEANLKSNPDDDNPEFRMYLTQIRAFQSRMYELFNDSIQIGYEIQEEIEKKVFKQIQLYDKEATPEDVKKYMENPEKLNEVINAAMYGDGNTKLKNAVSDLKEKLDDINAINRNVTVLVNLIQELQQIIQSQSELLNSIDGNMANVTDYVSRGVDSLDKAKEEYSSAMDKFCCIFFITLVSMCIIMSYLLKSVGI